MILWRRTCWSSAEAAGRAVRFVEAGPCTLVRTLKPVGTHGSRPEPTVTTVVSWNPPDVCRESGMRYHAHTTISSGDRSSETAISCGIGATRL